MSYPNSNYHRRSNSNYYSNRRPDFYPSERRRRNRKKVKSNGAKMWVRNDRHVYSAWRSTRRSSISLIANEVGPVEGKEHIIKFVCNITEGSQTSTMSGFWNTQKRTFSIPDINMVSSPDGFSGKTKNGKHAKGYLIYISR